MTKYVKKPLVIEAIRWNGNNVRKINEWVRQCLDEHPELDRNIAYFVPRRSAAMTETLWKNIASDDWGPDITAAIYDYLHETYVGMKTGQWALCGTEGEFYPHDHEPFVRNYALLYPTEEG